MKNQSTTAMRAETLVASASAQEVTAMPTTFYKVTAAALLLACQSMGWADDGGAAFKGMIERQQHEAGAACKLFSVSEVAELLGKPVKPGHVAGMGSGYQWEAVDSSGSFIVNRRPKKDYNEVSGARKFRRIKGIGSRAYIADAGGWTAGAISGENYTLVLFLGDVPEETAIKALRIAITR